MKWTSFAATGAMGFLLLLSLLSAGPMVASEQARAALPDAHAQHRPSDAPGVFAPASAACPSRPAIRVVAAQDAGRLRATLTASTSAAVPANALQVVRFGQPNNARVVLLNGTAVPANHVLTLTPPTASYQFFVERVGGGGVTVPLTVTDVCGDWTTFVGGGASFFGPVAGLPTSTPTFTPTPTVTLTPTPTSTSVVVAGQLCPQALHDAITVTGPDGLQYSTWHPPVDPGTGCYFGHEHGADPTTSRANASLPPFGYIGAIAQHAPEPHEGFKVFITALGTPGDNGPAPADVRIVFHMGTARIGRYTNQHHSMMFDAVHPNGQYAHIQGMADTGMPVGSTCSIPRTDGRDFSTVGCDDAYEIWNMALKIEHPSDPFHGPNEVRFTGAGAVAAFDPITTRDPADNTHLIYTEQHRRGAGFDPLLPTAQFRGCKREFYNQMYWNNGPGRPGASTVYWTDGMGEIVPGGSDPGQFLRQEIGQTVSGSTPSFKRLESFCDPTVRAPN